MPEQTEGVEDPGVRPPGQTFNNPHSAPKPPILTRGINLATWQFLATGLHWDQRGWDMSRLDVFKNVQEYSPYVHLNGEKLGECTHNHSILELAEIRYGRIIGIMGNSDCLFLILTNNHDGPGTPKFINTIPEMYVTIQLMDATGNLTPLTMEYAIGVPVLQSKIGNHAVFVMAVGFSQFYSEAIGHIISGELQNGASVCVSIRDIRGHRHDIRLCGAWKSGPRAIEDPNAIGLAYSTE